MNPVLQQPNEQKASEAFSLQAPIFDELYENKTIIRYKRDRVRKHFFSFLPSSGSILELNCGTGNDAIFFANKGYCVHATDVAFGMQKMLAIKQEVLKLSNLTFEKCSFDHLENLNNRGPYDAIFSNFAGLNCTSNVDKVLGSLEELVKPGGIITMVLMPRFSFWESLLLLRGKFRTATRRFLGPKVDNAKVEGNYFTCTYYSPGYITRKIPKSFHLMSLEGLCTFVPPPSIEQFPEKHPYLYRLLVKIESRLALAWPWRSIGDYYIITFKKATPRQLD